MSLFKNKFSNSQIFAVCTLFGIFTGVFYYFQFNYSSFQAEWYQVFLPEIVYWNVWGAIFILSNKIIEKFPSQKILSFKSLLVHIPLSLLIPLLMFIFYLWLMFFFKFIFQFPNPEFKISFFESVKSNLSHTYILGQGFILGFFIYWTFIISSYAKSYYENFVEQEIRTLKLESELSKAEFQALKMQLQPHFLFNTLNSISALLQTDTEKADKMLTLLGDFLRLTLERKNDSFLTLEEELKFTKNYLKIEEVRFGERLKVILKIQDEILKARVPNLILQPLVENAIQHGVSKNIEKGWVKIIAEKYQNDLKLTVADSGANSQTPVKTKNKGIGLRNTKSRLEQLYGDNFTFGFGKIEDKGFEVKIKIPLEIIEGDSV
ncbi:MAG: hypothetical protein DWQ06_06550 [Calditrichaeota bacterium]|nr:MAG: hypothetical protein DWQ06_06550 [Calditrichota bacterium]